MSLKLPKQNEPLSIILKLPGETCNINCYYCYEKRKPYEGSVFLQPDVLQTFLKSMKGRPLALELHGGEPLIIGKDKMKRLLQVIKDYDGPVKTSIQTNATLLQQDWIDFFAQEIPEIEIGVSLDGDPEANQYRVDYQDRPIHEKVEHAFRLLEKNKMNVGVISVVTKQALNHAQRIIEYFKAFECIKYLKFAPCLDYEVRTKKFPRGNHQSLMMLNSTGHGIPGWATTPIEYADFLIDSFHVWQASQAYKCFLIEPFVSIMRSLAGKSVSFCHFSQQKCAYVLTLYPDGRIGSCDELAMPRAFLARVGEFEDIEDILHLQTNQPLHEGLDSLLEKCASCNYQETCRGGCLATRLRYKGTSYDDEYCAYRIKIIDFVASQIMNDYSLGGNS